MIILARYFLAKNIMAMALWPFVLVKTKEYKQDLILINHERIHLRQQVELLIIPFYIWYLSEFLVHYIKYKDKRKAYINISFEKEAYANESDLDYLKKRKFWNFLKYV